MCDSILNPSTRKGMVTAITRIDRLEQASRRVLNDPKAYMRRGPRTMWCSPLPQVNELLCRYNAEINKNIDAVCKVAKRFNATNWDEFIIEDGFDIDLYCHTVLMKYFVKD